MMIDRMESLKEIVKFFSHCRGPAFDLGEPSLRFLGFQYQLPKKTRQFVQLCQKYDFCTLYIHINFRRIYTTLVTSQGRLPLGHHIFKDQEVFPPVLKLLTIRLVHRFFIQRKKLPALGKYMKNMIDTSLNHPWLPGIFTYMNDFYGKCRQIYHTWMLWLR